MTGPFFQLLSPRLFMAVREIQKKVSGEAALKMHFESAWKLAVDFERLT